MLSFGNKEFRNLQEQVLQNARDIATLKGRENLQIVIVEELPEVGNPNYIYLVPNEDGDESNVYNEYIWLADEEAFEKIGAVDIDLTNYVTLDTDQTVTGIKTFSEIKIVKDSNGIRFYVDQYGNKRASITTDGGDTWYNSFDIQPYVLATYSIIPLATNAYNIGSSSKNYNDLYLSGKHYFIDPSYSDSNSWQIYAVNQYNLIFAKNGTNRFLFQQAQFSPADYQNPQCNLGSANYAWKDAYIAGNISDGVNSVTVANISTKVTSTYASGTFDANGEDTIDISGGSPEGLFVFTYGNCQCFVRLTATMVQNADFTPISVSCPMIYNSATTLGWLNISRSSDTLTISVVDGTNHVDSGYAWTLVKTNLL